MELGVTGMYSYTYEYECICACGGLRLIPVVFLNLFIPTLLRQGLSVDCGF